MTDQQEYAAVRAAIYGCIIVLVTTLLCGVSCENKRLDHHLKCLKLETENKKGGPDDQD